MSKLIDLTDKRFGKLFVVKRVDNNRLNQSRWLCRCNCKDKNETIVLGYSLKNGSTQSCGCLRNEKTVHRFTKHGCSQNDTNYYIWKQMIQRCTNPKNRRWKNYGGRGIAVCQRWLKFENFLEDMGKVPSGLQIDRIDNNKGYCKENCHWVTSEQNNRNKRNNHLETYNEKTQCIIKWSEETGIAESTIRSRLKSGWSTEKAFTTPVKKYRKRRK